MDSVDRLLKTIRGVSKTNPVTNLQLSEIIRRLWSDQGKIINIIYNEITNNTTNLYQAISQIIGGTPGLGMDFDPGQPIDMGLPSTIDSTTENALTETSHTHKLGMIEIETVIKTESDFEFLYKHAVCSDSRNISSSDEWIPPTHIHTEIMLNEIDEVIDDTWLNAGRLLKSIRDDHWLNSNFNTDTYFFSLKGSGYRHSGDFHNIRKVGGFMCSDKYSEYNQYVYAAEFENNYMQNYGGEITDGWPLRLCNPSTLLQEGEFGTYTQNNGETIDTVVIGGIEWTQNSLTETEWRDHSPISHVQPSVEWEALDSSESAYCIYESNIDDLISKIEHNNLQNLDGGDFENNFYGHLTEDQINNLHKPVTINAQSAAFANIDENQVLTINSQTSIVGENTSVAALMGLTMSIEPLHFTEDLHNPWLFDCSDDGSIIIVSSLRIYISLDFGETFTTKEPFSASAQYGAPKCSSDGSIMWVGYRNEPINGAKIIVSSDFGNIWSDVTPPSPLKDFYAIGVSQDGESAIVGVNNGGVYKTINKGASWVLLSSLGTSTGIPSYAFFGISNDGLHIIATKSVVGGRNLLISTNGGTSFIDYWHDYLGWPINILTPQIYFVRIKGDKSLAAISHMGYSNEMGTSGSSTIFFYMGLGSLSESFNTFKGNAPATFIDKNITAAVGWGQIATKDVISVGSAYDEYPIVYMNNDVISQVFPAFINSSKSLIYYWHNHGGIDDFGRITFKELVQEAPIDGKIYGRKDGQWVEIIIL